MERRDQRGSVGYEKVGQWLGAQKLADLVPQLEPKRSEQGYATTDRERTRAHLSGMLDRFGGALQSCTVSIIWPNGSIPPHTDGMETGLKRILVVISGSECAWVMSGGIWDRLEQDGIYTMDPRIEHASINWGDQPRIALVADVEGSWRPII